MSKPESISLYYREGSSDKRYDVFLVEAEGGWLVNFAYGRRGSALRPGTKTNKGPLPYADAKKIYDKVVKSQLADGYAPGEGASPFQNTDLSQRVSGQAPQLLNPIDSAAAAMLIADPDWLMQEKKDGERRLIKRDPSGIVGINRKGLIVPLPTILEQSASAISEAFIIDGEIIGETFHTFDILSLDGGETTAEPYAKRLEILAEIILHAEQSAIVLVLSADDTSQKQAMFDELMAKGREGVVFKRKDSPYVSGRPASGGSQLKLKFYDTASAVVIKVNAKRSVALAMFDGQTQHAVGNVTIPANHDIPAAGDIVEVPISLRLQGRFTLSAGLSWPALRHRCVRVPNPTAQIQGRSGMTAC